MRPLAGRVAFITGTSRGIGRALADALAAAGAAIACTARSLDDAKATAAAVTAHGVDARGYAVDVRDTGQIDRAVHDAERDFGAIDILINNAGVTLDKASVDVTDDELDSVIQTNLAAVFRCCRAVAPGMIARKRGKIINIGSMYGRIGVARYAAYCATKAGVEALTRSLAVEWARHGIQVNCLAPGYVNTEIPRAALADERTKTLFLSKIPARRIGEPEELGPLAVYLASPASDLMTGQTLRIDGGQTIAW